jgi:hypothetical protein
MVDGLTPSEQSNWSARKPAAAMVSSGNGKATIRSTAGSVDRPVCTAHQWLARPISTRPGKVWVHVQRPRYLRVRHRQAVQREGYIIRRERLSVAPGHSMPQGNGHLQVISAECRVLFGEPRNHGVCKRAVKKEGLVEQTRQVLVRVLEEIRIPVRLRRGGWSAPREEQCSVARQVRRGRAARGD